MEQSTEADRSWPDHQQYPKLCRRPLTSSRCKNLRNKIILQAGYTAAHLCTEGSSGILYIHVYLQSSKYSMMPLDLLSRISELALKTLSNGPGLLNSPLWVFCFVLFLSSCFCILMLRSLRGNGTFVCFSFIYLFIYFSPTQLIPPSHGTSLHYCPGHCRPLSCVTTGTLEVNAAAPSEAHSQVLREGSKAGGGMRLCLPLAGFQNPSRYQCLQTPGRSSHT